jgi:hypothetical protein
MTAPDLSRLHDFSQPPPPSWMPQTIGWYVVFVLIVLSATWFVARTIRHWLNNRYRRDALRALQHAPAAQLSEILKRTAMVTWPRSEIASLTGDNWIHFLEKSSGVREFQSFPGRLIEEAALSDCTLAPKDQEQLRQLAARWVRTHHV